MDSAEAANFLSLFGPSIGLEVPVEDEAGIHEELMLEVTLIVVNDTIADHLYYNVNRTSFPTSLASSSTL